MGWNSWNYFGWKVTAADIRAAADAMVSSGMRDAGYKYIVIDDTWQGKRGPDGRIHPNKRFPNRPSCAASCGWRDTARRPRAGPAWPCRA